MDYQSKWKVIGSKLFLILLILKLLTDAEGKGIYKQMFLYLWNLIMYQKFHQILKNNFVAVSVIIKRKLYY